MAHGPLLRHAFAAVEGCGPAAYLGNARPVAAQSLRGKQLPLLSRRRQRHALREERQPVTSSTAAFSVPDFPGKSFSKFVNLRRNSPWSDSTTIRLQGSPMAAAQGFARAGGDDGDASGDISTAIDGLDEEDVSVPAKAFTAVQLQQQALSATLVLSVAVACLGAFAFGYHISVVNGPLDFIMEDIGAAGSAVVAGWTVSISLAMAALGATVGGALADAWGRRNAFVADAVPFIAGSVMSATATTVPQMLIGRALVGVAFGIMSCIVPLYISEISPTAVRGSFGSLNQLAICVGILSALLAGLPLAQSPSWWRSMFWLGAVPPLFLALGMLWAPESPAWLTKVGKDKEAQQAIARLTGASMTPSALSSSTSTSALASSSDSTSSADRLTSPSASPSVPLFRTSSNSGGGSSSSNAMEIEMQPLDLSTTKEGATAAGASAAPAAAAGHGGNEETGLTLLFSKKFRKVVGIGMLLFVLQQFAGINAVVYYSSAVFRKVGIQSDVAASALVGLANVLGTLVSSQLVDKEGRRKLLMWSFTGMGASMVVLSLTLALPALQPIAGPLSVAGTVVYVLAFAFGAGPVPSLLLPEIFPSAIRANAIAASLTTHWVCNFVIGLMFLSVVDVIGVSGAYAGFALVCAAAVMFVHSSVPETKGRSLEDTEMLFVDRSE